MGTSNYFPTWKVRSLLRSKGESKSSSSPILHSQMTYTFLLPYLRRHKEGCLRWEPKCMCWTLKRTPTEALCIVLIINTSLLTITLCFVDPGTVLELLYFITQSLQCYYLKMKRIVMGFVDLSKNILMRHWKRTCT